MAEGLDSKPINERDFTNTERQDIERAEAHNARIAEIDTLIRGKTLQEAYVLDAEFERELTPEEKEKIERLRQEASDLRAESRRLRKGEINN